MEQSFLRISTAGSVDDGKSTLIGRLLYDTKSIFEDQYEALMRTSLHRGEESVNLAYLTDGLRAEREQGITIDVAYRFFATPKRRYIIADTPGHRQYTRNMVTGASTSDVALILIDARNGMTDQSKRHLFIASLLRIPHVLVTVNKMDLVGWSEQRYLEIRDQFFDYAGKLELGSLHFVPVSALNGDNVVNGSLAAPWYKGQSVLEYLESIERKATWSPPELRVPVQIVLRPHQDFRGFAGRVVSGSLRKGEEILVLPGGTTAKVAALFEPEGETQEAAAGTDVVFTLDREVDVSRGDLIVRPKNPADSTQRFEATLCWMGEEPARLGKPYVLRYQTREVSCTLEDIVYRFDIETLHRDKERRLEMNDIGKAVINAGRPVFLDTYRQNKATGSFILLDPVSNRVAAAGVVTRTKVAEKSDGQAQSEVIWLVGLSGAGKSTIGDALVERLRLEGIQAVRLDGDDLRTGLNSDLGFSPEARSENLRRAAHVARLMARNGAVTVCSFISPLEADRRNIREIVGPGFIEVYVKTSLAECERRDPKGLYKRARAGEIKEFTGISSAFQEPSAPEVVVDTEGTDLAQIVKSLVDGLFERRG